MQIIKIIVQVLLALIFIMVGSMKVFTPYSEMIVTEGMTWAEEFSAGFIKTIGALEALGGLAVLLSLRIKSFQILVPLASLGFMILMIGAAYTHWDRDEPIATNAILFLVSSLVLYQNRAALARNKA